MTFVPNYLLHLESFFYLPNFKVKMKDEVSEHEWRISMAKAGEEGKATDEDDNSLDFTANTASGVHVTGETTTDSDGNEFEGVVF